MSTFSDVSNSVSSVLSVNSDTTKSGVLTSLGTPISTTETIKNVTASPAWEFTNERLHVIVPRSGLGHVNSNNSYVQDRGPIAKMRILSPNKPNTSKGKAFNNMDLTPELNSLNKGNYSKFMLTDVSVSHQEKIQVNSVFGDNEVVYYFGRNPPTVQISGIVFDSLGAQWFTNMLGLYQIALRGTELAKSFELLELILPNMKILGSISSLTHQQSSTNDAMINFSMQIIPKMITPLPILSTSSTLSNISNLLSFSVGKSGFGGSGFEMSIGNAVKGVISSSGFTSTYDTFLSELNSFRNNIVSPVYGMISIITKTVQSTSGDITSLLSSFSDPVNRILGDITSIATQAISLANLIEQSVNNITLIPKHVETNLRNTLHSLRNSAGVISRLPESVSEIIKRNATMGTVKRGSAILNTGGARSKSKSYLLSSGKPYSTTSAYKL